MCAGAQLLVVMNVSFAIFHRKQIVKCGTNMCVLFLFGTNLIFIVDGTHGIFPVWLELKVRTINPPGVHDSKLVIISLK